MAFQSRLAYYKTACLAPQLGIQLNVAMTKNIKTLNEYIRIEECIVGAINCWQYDFGIDATLKKSRVMVLPHLEFRRHDHGPNSQPQELNGQYHLSEWLYIFNISSSEDFDPRTTLTAPVAMMPKIKTNLRDPLAGRNHKP